MSVALLPISDEYGYTDSVKGSISSFVQCWLRISYSSSGDTRGHHFTEDRHDPWPCGVSRRLPHQRLIRLAVRAYHALVVGPRLRRLPEKVCCYPQSNSCNRGCILMKSQLWL
jgi:hypothetical protein